MSSRDPLLATYSYISPNLNGLLLGPFCVDCMNNSYSSDSSHFHSDVSEECGLPIFLHTKVGGKQYKINELVYLNGSRFPFCFRQLPDDVELLIWDCKSEECKEHGSQKQSRSEESPVFITPSSSTTSCSTLAVMSSVDSVKTGTGTITDCPINPEAPTAKVAVSDSKNKPGSSTAQSISKSTPTTSVENRKYLPLTRPSASLGGPKLTEAQFHEKMAALTEQLKVTNLEKFDKKFEATWQMKMDPYVCCGGALEKPHQILRHIVLHEKHVEWIFFSQTVTLEDVNEVLNKMKEVSKAPSPVKPSNSQLEPVAPPAMIKPVIMSTRPNSNLISFPANFPFLSGYPKNTVTDAMTQEEVESVLETWRPRLMRLASTICQLAHHESSENFDPTCSYCSKKFSAVASCMQHTFTERHVKKVYLNNMVFSRSRDVQVVRKILREAAKWTAIYAINTQSTEKQATITSAPATLARQPALATSLPYRPFSAENFPFLKGYDKAGCPDALTLEEAEAELKSWRPLVNRSMTAVQELFKWHDFSRWLACPYCKPTKFNPAVILQHSMSKKHVSRVYDAEMVFSRAKDLDVACALFQEVAKKVGYRCLTRSTIKALDQHRNVCRLPPTTVVSVKSSAVPEVPPRAAPILEAGCPLLAGHMRCECYDPVSPEEVDAELSVWRTVIQSCGKSASEVMEKHGVRSCLHCTVCDISLSPVSLLPHLISIRHIGTVYLAGLVFSRSQDVNMAVKILREVAAGCPAPPTPPNTTEAIFDEPARTVFWISEVEFTDAVIAYGPFPFLLGYNRNECDDAMTSEECNTSVLQLRSLMTNSAPNVFKTADKPVIGVCVHCNKFRMFTSVFTCLRHTLKHNHLQKAHSAGLVFSRSKDFAAANKLIQDALRQFINTRNTSEAADPIVDGEIAPVASPDPKPLEARPIQEVNSPIRSPVPLWRNALNHTMLMGNTVSLIPMLCRSRQGNVDYSTKDWETVLFDEELRKICLNFRAFSPPLPHLCGETRHPVCTEFIENCAPYCMFCNIEVKCICRMVTHFFSEQHCDALLRSGIRFIHAEMMIWTDVVDALMTEASPGRRGVWRSKNCWTNVISPENTCEENKNKSGCVIS